jgi:hypothetical protein
VVVRIHHKLASSGKLGRHDRPERRAAIVLEYVVRQSSATGNNSATGSTVTRLSMADLAKAVGIKLTHLQELHKKVGNYLQPAQQQQRNRPTTSMQSSTASRLVGRAPGAGVTTGYNNSRTQLAAGKESPIAKHHDAECQ